MSYSSVSSDVAERGAEGESPLAGSDHPADHSVYVIGHTGSVCPHHDGSEEAAVRGHIQPQLSGGCWCQTRDGQRPQSAPGGATDLRPLHPEDISL